MRRSHVIVFAIAVGASVPAMFAQAPSRPSRPAGATRDLKAEKVAALKQDVMLKIDAFHVQTQQMIDQVFSFGELGYQEFETSKYLTGILERNGFSVQRDVAGMPTAWVAKWGAGKPVIALGSDLDDIPQASQKPGVAYHDPIIEGAPGHGEGHNTGMPLQITAAVALKAVMEREHLSGTLVIWPGVAEELLAGKAHLVRAGVFKDVDVCLFAHVANTFNTRWGEPTNATGLVSVAYDFTGESAHAAAAPWRGRSALDAVELMDVGWNFRREHLRLSERSHYVITNGGDQPNVVPQSAGVWYFLRETDYSHIKELHDIANRMAQGAALMTDTTVKSRLLGAAWPQHFNKAVAEVMYENIKAVGFPAWDEADQTLAKAIQKELNQPQTGLNTKVEPLLGGAKPEDNIGGGSDDIGDVSWNVPTVTLAYPSNIPGLPGHNWANAIASATPIAHKGATAGAKAIAMTTLDFLMKPELVDQAWEYFRTVQTKNLKYVPLLGPDDRPDTSLNAKTMDRYREEMRKYYYDPSKYATYLDQLGITYPTIRSK
jgi:aminobenzoyl-glutamate utilization protein B